MKESNSNTRSAIKLLIGFLGVLAFLISYFLLLPRLQAQSEALETENGILKEQQREITDLALNEDTYREQAKLFEQEIAQIIEKYPACILEEDVIVFARELEKEATVSVSAVGMSPANLLYAMNAQTAPSAADTDTNAQNASKGGVDLGILDESAIVCPDYNLYSVAASYDFESDYKNMKAAFAQILSHTDKRNVPEMSLTRDDQSGLLIGNLGVNLYYMTNTGKIYSKPDPGVVITGNENPFGTLNLPDLNNLEDLPEDLTSPDAPEV